MRRRTGELPVLLALLALSATRAGRRADGQTYALSKLRGRTVVQAGFPKAFTAIIAVRLSFATIRSARF